MFENHIPVIHGILDHLDLKEILKCRCICSAFKDIVDEYLKKQESLSILAGEMEKTDSSMIFLMRSHYKFCNHLVISFKNLSKEKKIEFGNNVLKFFPNIRQLFLFVSYTVDVKSLAELLISHWKQINKLILAALYDEECNPIFFGDFFSEPLNLESLETLVCIDLNEEFFRMIFSLENQPFLNRVKTLFLPSILWLKDATEFSNLTSLGFQIIPPIIPEFEKIENLYFSDVTLNLRQILYFLRNAYPTNLSSFGFNFCHVSLQFL